MIYFDNSATTYPKPATVGAAMNNAVAVFGGNPGRAGHSLSVKTADAVFKVRQQAADLFGAKVENVVFTMNCTQALNQAIKGVVGGGGGHIVISSLEHNSVARPVYSLAAQGVSFSVAEVSDNDAETADNFARLITPDTKAVVCTAVSNVTGKILPIREIAKLCDDRNVCCICDAAQAAGVLPVKVGEFGNIICTAGHKGLYGPMGTGLLISDGKYALQPIMQGGTGTASLELEQPDVVPESLESGTVNVPGIVGLGKGIEFVLSKGISNIHSYEDYLCREFIGRLKSVSGIEVYRGGGSYAPVVAFCVKGKHSIETAEYLSRNGFALRGGYQCAAVAHKFLKTEENGVVRFSPSVFNNVKQVYALAESIKKSTKF